MGNQAGKNYDNQFGGIFVKLDQEAFNPLDTLSGTIYVDLKMPYPGDKLCIEVKGSEFTKWIDREARHRPKEGGQPGEMETYYVDIPREGKRDIISNDLTVYDWIGKQTIPPGQYTFPFAFQIPAGLPGSFFFQRGGAVAEIKYSVEGYLKPEVDTIPKLKHKLFLTMREDMQKNIQTKELNLTKSLSTWCCINQGTISLRTAFEKNAYAPGEEARMLTEIDNSKCGLNVDNVVFHLTQNIQVKDGQGHGRNFHFPIRSINLGTIPAGTSCMGNDRKSASIILPPGQEGKAKDFGTGPYQDPDPTQVITPSAHGKLVESDFSLGLTCSVEGCICCDSVPGVNMPIQVYAPLKARQPDPVPPQNWNPTPMPPANLTITIVQLANGGHEIHIDTGAPDQNAGMMGNQMPPQHQQPQGFSQPQQGFGQPQQGFGQPQQIQPQMQHIQPQPQMEPVKPQFNNSQQPLMNNSMNMNNSMGYPNQGMPQQQYQQSQFGQPQPLNPQPVQIGQNQNMGYNNQQYPNQYNQPGYNNVPQQQYPNQYNQPNQPHY